ncbi:MAG TPA: YfiR family protein [Bacteroidia bacterium]|nr:YfiR family protein [Bacteroidia bacterium]
MSHLLCGQNKTAPEYQVKAVFLYNFTQFIEWPPSSFKEPDDPFIIGIIGDDPFGSYLDETVAGERFGTHPIKIQRYNDVKNISNCQILYISSDDVETTKKILSAVSGKGVLTVSDVPNFYKWGGTVRFFTENNKIRLQINVDLSKAEELDISSKLLNVAKTN